MIDRAAVPAHAAVEAPGEEDAGGDAGKTVGLAAKSLSHVGGRLRLDVEEAQGLTAGVGAAEERDAGNRCTGGDCLGDPI